MYIMTEIIEVLNYMKKKIDKIDRRIDQIDKRIDQIDKKMDEIDKKMDDSNGKIDVFFTFVDYLTWVKTVTIDALKTSNVTYITDWLKINLHKELFEDI